MRLFCILLLVAIFLYAIPMLGANAKIAIMFFNIVGMIMVARWIANKLYPDDPLQELRNELLEDE